mgnify:CR=1 FL=1
MANIMKHVGTHGQKPCVVVFREVPNEPDNCLIVETGTLEDQKHDDLMNVVQSLEAQESNNVSEVLSRRTFTDGSNMLNDLHFSKKLIKVAVGNVNLTPTPADSISLAEVNAEINKIETECVIGFFGLIMQLGPIANWGLNINKKTIQVDTEKFETNQKGI